MTRQGAGVAGATGGCVNAGAGCVNAAAGSVKEAVNRKGVGEFLEHCLDSPRFGVVADSNPLLLRRTMIAQRFLIILPHLVAHERPRILRATARGIVKALAIPPAHAVFPSRADHRQLASITRPVPFKFVRRPVHSVELILVRAINRSARAQRVDHIVIRDRAVVHCDGHSDLVRRIAIKAAFS
jgi:hypothetical protein